MMYGYLNELGCRKSAWYISLYYCMYVPFFYYSTVPRHRSHDGYIILIVIMVELLTDNVRRTKTNTMQYI